MILYCLVFISCFFPFFFFFNYFFFFFFLFFRFITFHVLILDLRVQEKFIYSAMVATERSENVILEWTKTLPVHTVERGAGGRVGG